MMPWAHFQPILWQIMNKKYQDFKAGMYITIILKYLKIFYVVFKNSKKI